MRDLQAFLIKRFIYILVLVTVAQSLISFLISQAVMPVVMKVFFPDYQRQSSVGKTDLFIFIICVLLLLIVNAVRMLLPSPLQGRHVLRKDEHFLPIRSCGVQNFQQRLTFAGIGRQYA